MVFFHLIENSLLLLIRQVNVDRWSHPYLVALVVAFGGFTLIHSSYIFTLLCSLKNYSTAKSETY